MDITERERHAKHLLEDPLLNEAFDVLRTELMSEWEHSGSQNLDQRESIWLAVRLLERIRGHISSIVETGHMAKILEKQHPHI